MALALDSDLYQKLKTVIEPESLKKQDNLFANTTDIMMYVDKEGE